MIIKRKEWWIVYVNYKDDNGRRCYALINKQTREIIRAKTTKSNREWTELDSLCTVCGDIDEPDCPIHTEDNQPLLVDFVATNIKKADDTYWEWSNELAFAYRL